MSMTSFTRFAPAAVVLGLFTLVAATKSPPTPQMPLPISAPCSDYSQSSPGASTAQFSLGDGMTQPLVEGQPVYACSLHAASTGWSYANLNIREWDPVTLAPDPSTIALRTNYLDPSRMNYYVTNSLPWVTMSPPLILRSVAGVAEAPRTTVSMEVRSTTSPYNSPLNAYYEPAGDVALANAQSVSAGGIHEPLLGDHPVLGHAICDGGTAFANLRVAQCVKRTDAALSAHPFEIVQRFRVSEPVEARWIELAVNPAPGYAAANATIGEEMPVQPSATIAIVDATSFDEPPPSMPSALAQAMFEAPYQFAPWSYLPPPRWGTHYDFDHLVNLHPGRDYWLWVGFADSYEFLARNSTGPETPAFTAGIGPLYTRPSNGAEWSLAPNQALAFKVVGRPTAPVGAQPPRMSDPFRLAVSPNPARGLAQVSWSGAVGPVRIDVLDARGRRVSRGEGGAAGTWAWAATGRDGRPLAAGVYFVHARDSAGELSVERVVLVR